MEFRYPIYEARMNLAQDALARVASWNTGTYPLSGWLSRSMAGMGAPAPAATPSGLVSEHQALAALVDGRFQNPNWYQAVATENSSDLLRELVYEEAIRMKIRNLREEAAMDRLSLSGSDYAGNIRRSGQ